MAKKAASLLDDAMTAFKPSGRRRLIDMGDAEVRSYCVEVRSKLQANELGQVSLAHLYRHGRKHFGNRMTCSLTAFKSYVTADG